MLLPFGHRFRESVRGVKKNETEVRRKQRIGTYGFNVRICELKMKPATILSNYHRLTAREKKLNVRNIATECVTYA